MTEQTDGNEVSRAEFARQVGRDPALITRWAQNDRLVLSADGTRVLVKESIARLAAALDPARGGDRSGNAPAGLPLGSGAPAPGGADVGDLNYQREAARDKRASAMQRELDLAKAAGKLTEVDGVRLRIVGHVRAAIAILAKRRRRLAPDLALELDPRKIESLLEQSDRELAAELSALADGGGAAGDADEVAA